jgi:multiple sugar transport system permease protein
METKLARIGDVARYVLVSAGAVLVLFPIWWVFATSLETNPRAYSFPGALWPNWDWSNYRVAWDLGPWPHLFMNSLVVSTVTTALALSTALLAAYALTFMELPGSGAILIAILATMMVPFEAILVPEFVIVRDLGLVNTYGAQILPFAASGFAIFLLVQFMRQVPKELREAARIDGARDFQVLWHVMIPVLKPALATVGIYLFLLSWNAFLWPVVVTNGPQVEPLQVGLANFLQTANGTDWTVLTAAAVFVALPMLVLYVLAQRQVIEAVSHTGLKG